MKKAKTKRSGVSKKTQSHRAVFCDCGSLLCDKSTGFWGKDQPMVLLLSAGIVILIVVGLYLTGWL